MGNLDFNEMEDRPDEELLNIDSELDAILHPAPPAPTEEISKLDEARVELTAGMDKLRDRARQIIEGATEITITEGDMRDAILAYEQAKITIAELRGDRELQDKIIIRQKEILYEYKNKGKV